MLAKLKKEVDMRERTAIFYRVVVFWVLMVVTGRVESAWGTEQPTAPAESVERTALPLPTQGHEVTEIGQGYYSFRYKGLRNIFLITREGVIVTDPIEPAAAALMRMEIRKLTSLPVKYLIYSHQHWDHVRGGQIFVDEGAIVVSHERCLAHFRDLPHPEIVMPTETFSGERHEIVLGERRLQLQWLGVNHGDCLIVMTPDHIDIPFIVDLATAGGMPLPFIPDYSLHHWVRALRELEGWSFDHYVGGHGIAVAPKSRIAERREYVEALMTETRLAYEAGMPIEAIPNEVAGKLRERFDHLRGFNGIVRDNVRRTLTYYAMGW